MNIEELSKAQLVLLTILVNFVTSVTTGILTVSLLDHAPAYVTQTVDRVVERTIETVAQAAPAAVIATPAPSTQDLVMAAIGTDAARAVVLYDGKTGTSTPILAVGTFLPAARAIATAAQDALPDEVLVGFNGEVYLLASLSRAGNGIAIYGFSDAAKLPRAPAATLVASSQLRLGQTALAIAADGSAATGIVSRVDDKGVLTTLPDIGAGSAVVDLAGHIIGIAAGERAGLLIPANTITSLLTATSTPAAAKP